jgi:hypothetical protein
MYGTGTRSYNRSTEKQMIDKERRVATALYLKTMIPNSVEIDWCMCTCLDYYFPHPPHTDELAAFEVQYHEKRKIKKSVS